MQRYAEPREAFLSLSDFLLYRGYTVNSIDEGKRTIGFPRTSYLLGEILPDGQVSMSVRRVSSCPEESCDEHQKRMGLLWNLYLFSEITPIIIIENNIRRR